MNKQLICPECKMTGFHKMSCDSKGRRDTIKTQHTWRELNDKREALEEQHELLGRRYDELTKLVRKQGKDRVVDDYNKYLMNYAKDWDRL